MKGKSHNKTPKILSYEVFDLPVTASTERQQKERNFKAILQSIAGL